MQKFSELMQGNELIIAPVALNPIMARLAEEAGFKALYLSGGSLGWLKCVTEANLTLPELAAVALDMRAVCQLPIVLDAGGGWGDPVHVHRTIALAEAAGFAAIELEDQLLPRRVEHHVGVDHLIPTELMLKKIAEAIAARTDPDFVIIARTNARRVYDLDEAMRRAERYIRAGRGPRRRAAARPPLPRSGRRHAFRPHTKCRGDAHRRRAAATAAHDLCAAGRFFRIPLFAERSGRSWLPPCRLLRHGFRRDGQSRAPVL